MLQHINKRNNSNKQMEHFKSELIKTKLFHFMTIPVMLKQLVCLWHAGKPLGQTKCAIYGLMMELLLELAHTRLIKDPKDYEKKMTGPA